MATRTTRTRTTRKKTTTRQSGGKSYRRIRRLERSPIFQDFTQFIESWKQNRYMELSGAATRAVVRSEAAGGKKGGDGKKISLKIPAAGLTQGMTSERRMMDALGWYWEPLLYDLSFYEEMRDSLPIIDGQVQKLVDTALDGFKLQCGDPEKQPDLEKALLRNAGVNFRETLRRSMVDLFTLGNCYAIPIWDHDDKGRLVPKTFKPVRATAMRKLRDQNLVTEGYVQLLHRPSEFIFGPTPPQIPTLWTPDEVICGEMRTFGWYAYGKPLLASLPFVVRLKLTMERDLAEMLHQHVPRIDITFTPDEQLTQDQVDTATLQVESDVAALRPSDNFVHTPDTLFEYKGPQGHALDFSAPQKHIEDQIFDVLPFAPGIMGRNTQSNPYTAQQNWKLLAIIANSLRSSAEIMFAPALDKIAKDWGFDDGITFGWSELDPESSQQLAEAEEYHVNNATMKRDQGFIDQDTAAKQATAHHPDGPVKKASAPGQLPPPIDPNKPTTPGGGPVNQPGPKKDGTKTPAKDRRPKGKRHAFSFEIAEALATLGY